MNDGQLRDELIERARWEEALRVRDNCLRDFIVAVDLLRAWLASWEEGREAGDEVPSATLEFLTSVTVEGRARG